MTGGTTRLSVLLVLALLGQLWTANAASAPLDPFPLGTVGCLVADVCSEGELCVNDKLFGHCRSRLSPDVRYDYRLTLSARELRRLGETIASLVADQFTWRDAFTQCVIQNTLVAFARDQAPFHQRQCTQALMAVVEQGPMAEAEAARGRGTFGADAEIAAVLRDLLLLDQSRQEEGKVSTFDLDGAGVPDLGLAPKDADLATLGLRGQSDKRDEIVHVHKYFAQDPSDALKRQNPGDLGRDFEPAMADLDPLVPPYGKMGAGRDDLTYDDLQRYVASVEQLMEGSRAADKEVTDMAGGPAPPSDQLLLKEAEKVMEPETADKGPKILAISPPDERVLEQIMTGKLDPRELKGDQLRRLIKYIDSMVSVFDENEEEGPTQADLATAAESLIKADQSMNSQADGEARPEDNDIGAGYVGEPLPLDKKRVDSPPQQEHLPEAAHLKDNKEVVDTRYAFIQVKEKVGMPQALDFLDAVAIVLNISSDVFSDIHVTDGNKITFQVLPRGENSLNASTLANNVDQSDVISQLSKATGLDVVETGLGNDKESQVSVTRGDGRYVVLTLVLVGCIAGVLLAAVVIYLVKRHAISRQKLAQLAASGDSNEASRDYQDLCRQRMQSKSSEKPEPLHAASRIGSVSESQVRSPSSRSSTSSWSEEPVASNMDISTGHIVLSYMEDHLKNQDRLDQEWEALCAYEADPSASKVAMDASNQRKNRYSDVLPYDHSRVSLSPSTNVSGSDYINASFITDHDPRNPAYIACQGPLPHTVADFWQMVWEQGSVVIVMLTKLTENGTALCHRYWPEEGSDLYHIYEVHLVSEHIWCDDYLVRSFYLKNLQTNETRTVTQFHFLTWPQLAVPASIKALLDFRRKVNKSYRGRSCPIVVHCSDGCGRAGTYILVDMVLNRMAKGAKEIDMAATLEHIRDQRMAMVKTKEQFQFALAAVAEEVNAILKALPQ